jgi:hypothetical protein
MAGHVIRVAKGHIYIGVLNGRCVCRRNVQDGVGLWKKCSGWGGSVEEMYRMGWVCRRNVQDGVSLW